MLPVPHQPEKRRECADVHTIRSNGDKMRSDAVEFGNKNPYIFHPFWNLLLDSQHSLNAHGIRMLAVHRCYIVEPVDKWNNLVVREIFTMLFKTTVQVSEVWHNFLYDLSIH